MHEIDIAISINGAIQRRRVECRQNLTDFLREGLGLTGTHAGCEHGVCGACTVLIDGSTARSCLALAGQMDGHAVTSIEGLETDALMQLLQDCFHRHTALQCGFCTPGMLIASYELVRTAPSDISREGIRAALSGNVCRCTGYHSIVSAVAEAIFKSRDMQEQLG